MNAKEFLELYLDNDQEAPEGWKCVDNGDWVADYKYQTKEEVYSNGSQFFCVVLQRSGSPFSEYNYEDPDCFEVKPQEVTTVIYVTV